MKCLKGITTEQLIETNWVCPILGFKIPQDQRLCDLCQQVTLPIKKKGKQFDKDLSATFDEDTLKWDTQPLIPKCWKGTEPQWNPNGVTFQGQLWCVVYQKYINPDGTTCSVCREEKFPPKLVLEKVVHRIQSSTYTGDRFEALARLEKAMTKAIQEKGITIEEAYELLDLIEVEEEEEEKSDVLKGTSVAD